MTLFEYLNARAIRNANIDLLIGRTQRNLSRATLAVIAGVLAALFLYPKIDPLVEKLLLVVLGALMSNWATQNGFWFGRPRGVGVPDPSTTTIETNTSIKTGPSAPANRAPIITGDPNASPSTPFPLAAGDPATAPDTEHPRDAGR